MTDDTPTVEHEQVPTDEQPRPGRRLREAREAKGLSIQEVASQLRLQQRLIEALEEDNEAALPPATFVSGYLRSYARLLAIPEETVLPPSRSDSEPPLVATIAHKGEASSRDWPARLITYLVIGAIIVSAAMWLVSQRNTEEEPVAAAAKPQVMEQGGNVSLALPEMAQSVSPAADENTEAAAEQEAAPPAETAEAAPTVDETSAPKAQPEVTATQAAGPSPLTDATPQSKLELRYAADSWTEVTDNAGRQLAYGLIKAGQVVVLRGEAPFRVFLGYAPGVNVYYNGDLFDHSPFQRRDVARFRVGRAEHNHPGSR